MSKRFWWGFLATAAAGAMVGLLLAAVVVYVTPKQYEGEAVIEVKPRIVDTSLSTQSDLASPASPASPASGRTMNVCGTPFDKIKSRKSLEKVVENLELTAKWRVDKEIALQILKKIVTRQDIVGTDLISIKVRHTNREEARDIAVEVARTYREYRNEIERRDLDRGLVGMERAIRDQEFKVEERRKFLSGSMRGFTYREPDAQALWDQQISEAVREIKADQALLEQMKLKQIKEVIAAKVSASSVVVHDGPQVAQSYVWPNVTLFLVIGTAGGILLSPLLALWLITMKNGPFRSI